jgi:hypothetical protein
MMCYSVAFIKPSRLLMRDPIQGLDPAAINYDTSSINIKTMTHAIAA